ncbi:tRNA lysidine(34) synthetase TilS [Pseudomonas sp.]|uniref:tRNA lysidine(34) synthetase TilS n=1 Tax=Pseudomonas sp. TaxID=306 RepID=UPI003CC5B0BC
MDTLLHSLALWRSAPRWHIALSGGLDSTVLLHQLATLARTESFPPLRAIHVHHGLQAAADAWPHHCQRLCDALGVPLTVVRVQVAPGASLEAAAREARYAAFEQVLGEGEVLLTGQHRDDQAETLLFRLLRGTGVRGLAGMSGQRPLGRGMLVRPMLQISREQLEGYARANALEWVEDPSNSDTRFSRNYLRSDVLPVIARRWPRFAQTFARTASHLAEAHALLVEVAEQDLQPAQVASPFPWLNLPSLALAPLLTLSDARQRNALQHWLSSLTRLPDSQHWAGWQDLRDAAPSATPVWVLADGRLLRAGERLWWLADDWLHTPAGEWEWADPAQPLSLAANGQVRLCGLVPQGRVQIRYRQGGEVLEVPGRGHRDLKRLLNETGLPPFVRARLPLLFIDGRLHAVANLPGRGGSDALLHWMPPTNAQRLR